MTEDQAKKAIAEALSASKVFAQGAADDLSDKAKVAVDALEYSAKGFWGKIVTNVTSNPKLAVTTAVSAGMVVLTALTPAFAVVAIGVCVVAPFVVNSMSSTK